jgi:hypothetical protein
MSEGPLTIELLERWALAGAHWRVIALDGDGAVVELCACTGEPVELMESDNRELMEYLQSARSDLDLT